MPSVSIIFAGDFCSKSSASVISLSDELKTKIRGCDLRAINFEVPLRPDVSMPKQKRERFFQNDDTPDFLKQIGFNLFSFANNHAFDWGVEGFEKTKAAFGDCLFGAGTYDEAYKVKICEINGCRIGFMALTFSAYTGVFDNVLDHGGKGCAFIGDSIVNHVIIRTKEKVDYLFILAHDGIEYIDIPMPETVARYRDFIDYGADGVIGTHPHCPQGWEDYKGKPIFYSLGNFLFNSKNGYNYRAYNRPHWYEGLCVVINICDGQLNYEVINTLNVDNLGIVVDHSEVRNQHNRYLCNILQDCSKYKSLLERECKRLACIQELPIIDRTFHDYGLKSTVKALLKYVINYIRHQPRSNDKELYYLLKNDCRRSVLLRGIKE